MTEQEALAKLEDEDVVSYGRYGVRYARELRDACLGADIPVALASEAQSPGGAAEEAGGGRTDGASTGTFGGAMPKVDLVVRRDDTAHVDALLATHWQAMAAGEGDLDPDLQSAPAAAPADSDEPRCPACGAAAPADADTCSDCGLYLGE